MKIETGYLYHIKEEFFEKYNDGTLMVNHEYSRTRPTYFTIKDEEILWFIPLSTKVEKYKKIYYEKTRKYKACDTIIISKLLNKEIAILIQNAFPTLEKYIDHIHTYKGEPLKVSKYLQKEILKKFNACLLNRTKSNKIFFSDIDSLKKQLLLECKKSSIK